MLSVLRYWADVARYLSKGAQPESTEAEKLRALVSQTQSVNCGTGAGEQTCCQIGRRPADLLRLMGLNAHTLPQAGAPSWPHAEGCFTRAELREQHIWGQRLCAVRLSAGAQAYEESVPPTAAQLASQTPRPGPARRPSNANPATRNRARDQMITAKCLQSDALPTEL